MNDKKAYVNMYLLNGHEDMEATAGKAVIVENGRISDIVDEAQIPEGCEKVDLGGAYMLPGLINLHVHIPSSGKPKKGKTDYNKIAKLLKFGIVRSVLKSMCQSYAAQQLYSGTTTIRAVGGIFDFDTQLRDKINAGKAVGPRILAANYAVSVPGGHMTGTVALPANSPEEAADMVSELAKSKPDHIKLMITGGVLDAIVPGEPGILKMPAEYVKAACDRAHSLGLKVAAHVESTEGMVVALENGVDTIEHGGKSSPRTTELFKQTGSVLVATLSPAVPFAVMDQAVTGMSDTDLINGKALFSNMIDCINDCRANGITVGLGTDTGCPYITHYDMWRELWYYQKYIGVTALEAIHTATMVNAAIAGIDKETGSIDPGKSADFLIVKGNPLEDLTALSKPEKVIFRGSSVDVSKLKKMPQVEDALSQVMSLQQ